MPMGDYSTVCLLPEAMLQVTSGNSKGEKHTREFLSYLLRRKIEGEL